MKVYAFGGLGADHRIFDNLDIESDFQFIPWIRPLKNEKIEDYCTRLASVIEIDQPFALLGVSFGGIVAQEISKTKRPEKLILISSLTNTSKLPMVFRILGKLRFFRVIPKSIIKPPKMILKYLFTIRSSEAKNTLYKIIEDTDPDFLKWALVTISLWEPQKIEIPIYSIHGTSDMMIKPPNQPFKAIPEGGHFMIYENADLVSTTINAVLKD